MSSFALGRKEWRFGADGLPLTYFDLRNGVSINEGGRWLIVGAFWGKDVKPRPYLYLSIWIPWKQTFWRFVFFRRQLRVGLGVL